MASNTDFQILLMGALDEAKSKASIESGIQAVQSKIGTVKLKAELDTSEIKNISSQIQQATKSAKSNNNIARQILNTSDLDKQGKIYIQKVSNTIEKTKSEVSAKLRNAGFTDIQITGVEKANGQIKSLTATATNAAGVFEKLNFERAKLQNQGKAQSGLVQTDDVKVLGTITTSMQNFQATLANLKSKWQEQGILVGEFKDKVVSLETELSNVSSKGDMSIFKNNLKSVVAEANSASSVMKSMQNFQNLKLPQITDNVNNGFYIDQISQLAERYNKLGLTIPNVQSRITALQSAEQNLTNTINSGSSSLKEKQDAMVKYNTALQNASRSVSLASSTYKSTDQVDSLIVKMQAFLSNNTAITRGAKNNIQGLITSLQNAERVTGSMFNNVNTQFNQTAQQMRSLGKLGDSFFTTMKKGMASFSYWTSATFLVMKTIQGIKSMVSAVYDIDTAMTNLYKVTDETDTKYNQFLVSASKNAKELGRSVSSLVEQTATWAKLGYSLDDSADLAKVSSVYANVGEVDDETAVSDIITAMKSFNITASQSISIVDKLNEVSNNYAVSAADLGEGLSNAASAMSLGGNDIDQTIAMITAMTEITQNASESGNALKVLSMRLRGAKTEIEQIGESTDGMAESTSKLQAKIKALTNIDGTGGFDIMADANNFKSTYDIMQGISNVWSDINNVNQAALLEIIAGKQRGNSISALLTNMAQAENVYTTSTEAAGSASEEQERWMESLEAKTQQFEAAFQSLSQTVMDSDVLKFFVDFGTAGTSAIDTITQKLNAFTVLMTGFGAFAGAKNFGKSA